MKPDPFYKALRSFRHSVHWSIYGNRRRQRKAFKRFTRYAKRSCSNAFQRDTIELLSDMALILH